MAKPPSRRVPSGRGTRMTWYEVPVRVFAPSGELARALVYRPLSTAASSSQLGEFGVGIATRVPASTKPQKETAGESGSDETLHL